MAQGDRGKTPYVKLNHYPTPSPSPHYRPVLNCKGFFWLQQWDLTQPVFKMRTFDFPKINSQKGLFPPRAPLFCPQQMKLHLHVGGNITKHSFFFSQSAEFMVTDN